MHEPEPQNDEKAVLENARRLQAFADSLASKKTEAVDAVKSSGITREWTELEEYYDGIDDSNRSGKWEKPSTSGGRLIKDTPLPGTRSTLFLNIFQPYVDMGSARANEILVPTNDKPFGLRPTPMQDIQEAADSTDTIQHPATGEQLPAADIAKSMLAEAKAAADKAEKRIWDWWTEWRWQSEGRKMIDMAAKIGTVVFKGPFPKKFKAKKVNTIGGQVSIEMIEKMKPVSRVIHPKNFFPDPACGEDIHAGSYVWERDHITAKQLRELIGSTDSDGNPLYLDDQIKLCLIEGPGRKYESDQRADRSDKDKFEIWYYHGSADHENMQAAGCECEEDEVLPVSVFTVNDRVIKAKLNTLDSGEFPYDVLVWQVKPGTWTGIGVGHQVITPQRMLNAAVRNLMDNAGMSSAPIIIFDDELIEPADGSEDMTLRPRMVLRKKAGATMTKAADAITSITIPSLQQELMNIINFAMQMAEKVTGMAIQQQGQQGENEETAAGRQILQANAGALMRRICKIFDDRMAPHVARYYEWLLIYGEDPAEKGDFIIDVLGSTVMFERDAKNMLVAQMMDRAANPIYGLNPEKLAKEWLAGQGFDVERVEYTKEEKKQMAEAAAKQPQDPAIAVAQMREQGATDRQQIKSQETVEKMRLDTDRDTLYEQTMAQREQTLQAFKERELMLKREIELMKENGESARQIDELKVKLADTTMKLATQEKLAKLAMQNGNNNDEGKESPQVTKPPSEPPGRAKPGNAFPA